MSARIRGLVRSSPVSSCILFLSILFLFSSFFVSFRRTSGTSMAPTYQPGSILLCTKTAEPEKISRGTCVIAESDEDGRTIRRVKRVVACPGDRVQVVSGCLYVNGEMVDDGFPAMEDAGLATQEILLAEDEYFLLGDNRNASIDSRVFGPVNGIRIKNIVLLSIF